MILVLILFFFDDFQCKMYVFFFNDVLLYSLNVSKNNYFNVI